MRRFLAWVVFTRSAFTSVSLLALVAVTLVACSRTPRPRLYVLAPLEAPAAVAGASAGLGIGVGPVTLAPHLDRPQIVTRRGGEVHLDELDRWAEPLADGVARVLAESLGALLATERTWIYPWRPSVPVDVQASVEVLRFDSESGGDGVLVARWTLFDGAGEVLCARRFEHREPVPAASPAATVEALGRGLAALSREIAREIGQRANAAAG